MFGRKKKEGSTTADKGKDNNKPEAPQKVTPEKKAPPAAANASRRTVTKPDASKNQVLQKHTQILYRLNHAVKQRPLQPSRSTELIPLNKEFEDMRKHLRALVHAVKKYHQALQSVSACRQEVVNATANLAIDTPLADAVSSKKVVLGESLVTQQDKLATAMANGVTHYQSAVVDYVTEWDALLSHKIDAEVKYTQKLQKNLKHYETKVEKLRKAVATKEDKGKPVPPAEVDKLARNETKLKESWHEYETTATQTSHLLDEATRQGWKDLHPLLKAMLTAEYRHQVDVHAVWNLTSSVQDKVAHIVDKYDVPLPASAFAAEIVLTSHHHSGGNNGDDGKGDSSDDLQLSDNDDEELD